MGQSCESRARTSVMGLVATSKRQNSVSEIIRPNAKPEERCHADGCAGFLFGGKANMRFPTPSLLRPKTGLASHYFRNSGDPQISRAARCPVHSSLEVA